MDCSVSDTSRPKRQPLGDASNRINIMAPTQRPSNDNEDSSKRNSAVSTTSTTVSGKPRRKTHVGPWQLGRTLGKGSTGRVRLAKHAVTGQTAAIKIVSKKSAAIVQSESIAAMKRPELLPSGGPIMPYGIEREVVIMKLIEHPNVINLYDVWENRGELYLVLEHVGGGELFDYVSANGALPEEEAVRLFRQIIAGLSYCHRFNICHRDLKPENILLDINGNIKLADFGMAALQPAGHWLNTSCGSPHYAAPEIIYGRRYRGDKADIWSCGIILFAMLTGFLPFDGGDLTSTLRLVKKGEYVMPPWLTTEAVDLIQRILQKRPEDRISMKSIWAHPLLKKYEILHYSVTPIGVDPPGPPPPLSLEECGPPMRSILDIDMELLRGLQTLWHEVKQETLIENLLSPEPNHEKLFYNALIKFRNEQLENYEGLEYSASDYHHISRPVTKPPRQMPRQMSRKFSRQLSTPRVPQNGRRLSQFSIATDDACSRKISYKEPKSARTLSSYDPYRSSRTPVSDPPVEYASVTVHRHASNISKSGSAVAKVKAGEASSSSPISENSRRRNHLKRNSAVSFQSRSSIASSQKGSAPNSVRRGYQRNVSFRHVRKRPRQASYTQPRTSTDPAYSDNHTPLPNKHNVLSPNRYSSPSLPTPLPVRHRKASGKSEVKPKSRVPSNYWREDARKVSSELGQICEEAFNRTSVSADKHPGDQSDPATTEARRSEGTGEYNTSNTSNARPLSERGPESTTSYTTRELIETRRRLIEYSTKEHAEGLPAYLTDVIAHLDRLIGRENDHGRRAISDPMSHLDPVPEHLPPISEEQQMTPQENDGKPKHRQEDDTQRVSSGSTKRSGSSFGCRDERSTIRIVPPTPASAPQTDAVNPLTIRKRSSDLTAASQTKLNASTDFLTTAIPPESSKELNHSSSSTRRGASSHYDAPFSAGLDTILEDPRSPKRSDTVVSGDNKKWNWFKHKSQCSKERSNSPVKDSQPSRPASALGILSDLKLGGSSNEDKGEKVVSKKTSFERGRDGFLKLFGKKKQKRRLSHEVATGEAGHEHDDSSSIVTNTAMSEMSTTHQRPTQEPQPPKAEHLDSRARSDGSRNWFTRFFHVKPARRVIALNASKSKGRKEVVKVLKEWKQYGLEGVQIDKTNNILFGSVGEVNFLRLKPVDFSAEFFTVLEHGHRANLSLIHFKQERGAASSFHKVVDTLHMVLKQRGLAVQDPARAKKMAKVLS